MPELPEVQTVVNDLLEADVLHRPIRHVDVFWGKSIAGMSAVQFRDELAGHYFTTISRRGKYIAITLSSACHLFIHLRMSGRLYVMPASAPRGKHEHIILTFDDDRQIRFHDPRKFGRWTLTADPGVITDRLGIEPLSPSFQTHTLERILRSRHSRLKPLLLNQSLIAGLGNIYVDEALWAARIHPEKRASSLSAPEIRALHRSIATTLKNGIKNRGTSLGNGKSNFRSIDNQSGGNAAFLAVYGRAGFPCRRCGAPIQRMVIQQRSTHFCPICQKAD